jgi:hypothetical protein
LTPTGAVKNKYKNNTQLGGRPPDIPASFLVYLPTGNASAQLEGIPGRDFPGCNGAFVVENMAGGGVNARELGYRGPKMAACIEAHRRDCVWECAESCFYRRYHGILYA